MPAEAPLLLADVGNSRVKWASTGAPGLVPGRPFPSALDALESALWKAWGDLPAPREVWLANVAGDRVRQFVARWVDARWGLPLRLAAASAQAAGVRNGYDQPEGLGVDRWLALLAARERMPGPVCVADCGTAITIDVLDGTGQHHGGVIAPGLGLMRRALALATDGALSSRSDFRGVFARATGDAVQGGTLNAAAGLIEKLVAESAEALDGAPGLILTGGDAPAVARVLKLPHEHVPLLVLEGLWLIAGKNG